MNRLLQSVAVAATRPRLGIHARHVEPTKGATSGTDGMIIPRTIPANFHCMDEDMFHQMGFRLGHGLPMALQENTMRKKRMLTTIGILLFKNV